MFSGIAPAAVAALGIGLWYVHVVATSNQSTVLGVLLKPRLLIGR